MPDQTWPGMSKSKPGRTSAPCGNRATACISSAVVPRDPVDPATITGCGDGVSCQLATRSSTARRWRAAGSTMSEGAKNGARIARKSWVRFQWAEWSETSSAARASGDTPSSCNSSISVARLSDRSNSAARGARSGWASSSRRISCDSSSRRRSGVIAGRASSSGPVPGSVTRQSLGRKTAPRAANTSRTARRIRVVFR